MPRRKPNKTRKAAVKRFKISATGKLMRRGAGKRHLATCKTAKQKRRLRGSQVVSKGHAQKIVEAMPFSHRG